MLTQVLIAVLASAVFYGYWGWRHRSDARTPIGFFQAGRNMGSVGLSGTYIATSLALANAIFYFLWLGYTAGLVGIWIQLAWCLGFVVLYSLIPKMLRESGTKTLHEFVGTYFGRKTAVLAAVISCVGIGLNFGYEIVVGSTLSMSVWPDSPGAVLWFAIVMTLIVVAYCVFGGFAAVLRTDTFQWIVSSIALLAALLIVRHDIDSSVTLTAFHQQHSGHLSLFSREGLVGIGGLGTLTGGIVTLISFLIMSIPWQFCDMTSWQKLSACDPKRQAGIRSGVLFSGVYVFFMPAFITLMIGVYLRHYDDAGSSLLGALLRATSANPIFGVFILFGLLAALVSTADTYLIGSLQAFVLDVLHRRKRPSRSDEPAAGIRIPEATVPLAKKLLPIVAAVFLASTWGYWAWHGYDNDSLFTMVLVVYSMQLSLVWVMLVALFDLKGLATPAAGVLSLVCGVGANLVTIFLALTGRWEIGIAALGIVNASASFVGFAAGRLIFGGGQLRKQGQGAEGQ